jgi:hypothetical protein
MLKFFEEYRRASPFRCCGRRIVGRVALLAAAAALCAGAGPTAAASDLPWSWLVLQASRLGSTATAEIKIESLAAADEAPKFIDSPRSEPMTASGAAVQKLSVTTTLVLLGGHRVQFENRLWVDPLTHTPLYLVRTRSGLKDYHQRFRFTRKGVFRLQREPASVEEAGRPPEFWTKIGEHFYPSPSDREICSTAVETSMLIPLIGAPTSERNTAVEPLCVFHKRQFHRVSMHSLPIQAISFDYLEKRTGQEARRVGTASAVGVFIASRPIGSYRGDVEDFIRGGSRLYLSTVGRLPLAVSGELPLIGRVEMQLREIHLK